MAGHIIVTIVSLLLIFVGVVGSAVPSLPGPPISLIGLILYGWFTNFHKVSVFWIVIFAIATLVSLMFDLFAPGLIAKGYQSSKYGAWGAVLGGFVGLLSFGPLGAFAGPFLGAFIGEYYASYDSRKAARSAWGALVGILVGTMFKFIISVAILGYFLTGVIRGL